MNVSIVLISTYMYLTDDILVQGQTSLYHQENEFRALQSACMSSTIERYRVYINQLLS
jgi:hypothetical protein